MSYQAPEIYVNDFVEEVVSELEGRGILKRQVIKRRHRWRVDYSYGGSSILIEAEPPGGLDRGREQLVNYMNNYGVRLGVVIDVPKESYYKEYPNPYNGRVGFEVYLDEHLIYKRTYDRGQLVKAKGDFKSLLEIAGLINIAAVKPDPENILAGVNALVEKWKPIIKDEIPDCKREQANRICVYKRIWEKNMELIYGKNVLDSVGGKKVDLYAELTIYVTLLKILGSTILESIHGGGRYTIPLRLAGEGSNATLEMFWERKALSSFNTNYIFERDEYDWIFSPDTARELDGFFQDIGKLLLKFDWSAPIGLDLLKRVYMNIVDRDLRRQLGEFYTPDWLAKMMLWRALHMLVKGSPPKDILISNIDDGIVDLINEFYEKNGRIPRVVDPTCGSFTFGVQYLSSLLEWYARKKPSMHPVEMASQILENVVGFDVNPVAVITAKVNYLLQIHRLLTLADSYLYEEPLIPVYRLDLTMIHDIKKSTRTLGKGGGVGLEGFMQTIEWLEANDIDTIRASLLKGYTMALATSNHGFDIVIGNLPWINISKLPGNYRKKLSNLSKELGVNPTRQATKKLDISVVLFAVSIKHLLRSGGVVALMVPTSIFRGLHGSGWRFFVDRELSLYEVFDLEEIKPFEQAVNQPGIVLAAKRGGGDA